MKTNPYLINLVKKFEYKDSLSDEELNELIHLYENTLHYTEYFGEKLSLFSSYLNTNLHMIKHLKSTEKIRFK